MGSTLGTMSKAISANTAWHGLGRLKGGRPYCITWFMKKSPTDFIKNDTDSHFVCVLNQKQENPARLLFPKTPL
jgi:hypothetical protein